MQTQMKQLKWRFMQSKLKYKKPTITINEFSVNDIIHASTTPCPAADTCGG